MIRALFDFEQSACSGIIGNDHAITVTDRKLGRCLIGLETSNKSLGPFVIIEDLFEEEKKEAGKEKGEKRKNDKRIAKRSTLTKSIIILGRVSIFPSGYL